MRRTSRTAAGRGSPTRASRPPLTASAYKVLHHLRSIGGEDGPSIDWLAASAFVRSIPELMGAPAPERIDTGMTILEAAAYLGVDRRKLGKALFEISPGPVPALPSGRVPARRIGKTLRIFVNDLLGLSRPAQEYAHASDRDSRKASSGSAAERTEVRGRYAVLRQGRA